MVSLARNHHLHISTWSSKTTENCAQRVPFETPLTGFCGFLGAIWGDGKIVAKIEWPMVTREIRESTQDTRKMRGEMVHPPCVPLKDSQDGGTDGLEDRSHD